MILRVCQSCDICQRTIPKGKLIKAPLDKMPRIEDREDDEQSKQSSGTSQVCADSIFDMASEWSIGQVMNGLIGTKSRNGVHGSSQVSVGQSFNAGEAIFAVYLMAGIVRVWFYLSVRSAGDIICDVMCASIEMVLLCLDVGSVGGVVCTFVDVVYRWLWLFRWKTKVGIILDNTMKCGEAIRHYVQLKSTERSKFKFKYVNARRIQKLQVYYFYMCIALTLQPYRFHITAIRGSENVGQTTYHVFSIIISC